MSPADLVLYHDEALIALDKPSGVAVHRGWAAEGVFALALARGAAGRKVYPVHRLDQATSGVLVFALTPEIAGVLGQAFMRHEVEKRYLAFVRGIPPEHIRVDHPIKSETGELKPAVTSFRRLWVLRKRYSLVEARPETGRSHQIRRHLKHLSCPVIGDTTYGKSQHNRLIAAEFGLARLALHAASIAFVHPVTQQRLEINAPLPADFALALARMECPSELLAPLVTPG